MELVDFEALLENTEPILQNIADYVGLQDKSKLIAGASTLRSPTSQPFDSDVCSKQNLDAANTIYARLKSLSIWILSLVVFYFYYNFSITVNIIYHFSGYSSIH